METNEEWWPNTPWRMEGFRANPELRDGFVALHEELGDLLKAAHEKGDEFVPVDVRTLSTVYYALLAQIQISNQTVLLELQDLRNDIAEMRR